MYKPIFTFLYIHSDFNKQEIKCYFSLHAQSFPKFMYLPFKVIEKVLKEDSLRCGIFQ